MLQPGRGAPAHGVIASAGRGRRPRLRGGGLSGLLWLFLGPPPVGLFRAGTRWSTDPIRRLVCALWRGEADRGPYWRWIPAPSGKGGDRSEQA